ncbi:hypothetical protein SMNI109538_08120 [Smaragdicoccus niigatensis]
MTQGTRQFLTMAVRLAAALCVPTFGWLWLIVSQL